MNHAQFFYLSGDLRHLLARDGTKAMANGWWGRGGRRFFRRVVPYIPIIVHAGKKDETQKKVKPLHKAKN